MPPSTTPTRSSGPPINAAMSAHEPVSQAVGLQAGHPHRGKGQDVSRRHNADCDQHRARISPLRTLDFCGNGGGVVPSHVIPHADEQTAENVYGRSSRLGHGVGQRAELEGRHHHDHHERRRQGHEQPQRSERYHFHSCNVQQGTRDHYRQRNPPSAIILLEPREHPRQVGHKQRGINRHVENGRNQREPGFLKSPEVAHGAAHPGVVAAFVRQRARQLADHEGGGQAPEQRRKQQNQDGASVAGAMHDVFGAIGSARHHKEGGGDQGPQREANEAFLGDRGPVGYGGE